MADLTHYIPHSKVSKSGNAAISDVTQLKDDYIEIAKSYSHTMRSYFETYQLFDQFCWSYRELIRLVPCDRNDRLSEDFQPDKFSARTVVNGAFGNFVSAARNVLDKMQAVMGDYYGGRESKGYLKYWKLPSSWFDQGGIYVFMYELRNPVQHGQTVVSVVPEPQGTRLRFDLNQIADPHLYNKSKNLTSFIKHTSETIRGINPNDPPYLCFRHTNMFYYKLVIQLYAHFLKCAKPHIRSVRSELNAMLSKHEEFVGWNKQVKFVVYTEGDETHVLEGLEDDPVKEIRKRRREVEHLLFDAEKTLKSEKRCRP